MMMEKTSDTKSLLLLDDATKYGRMHQVVEVPEKDAVGLLAARRAFVATPNILLRFRREIKNASLPPEPMSRRKHFEDLLTRYMKQIARAPVGKEGKAIPEVYTTFRAGFRTAFIVLELINDSTTELSDDVFDLLNSRLEIMVGDKPPIPNE